MPIFALVMSAFSIDETGSFQHLIDTVLFDYTLTTLLVIGGVLLLSFCFALQVLGLYPVVSFRLDEYYNGL